MCWRIEILFKRVAVDIVLTPEVVNGRKEIIHLSILKASQLMRNDEYPRWYLPP